MLKPVFWQNAEARTIEDKVEEVVVVLWDWEAKQGKAMLNGSQVDVYMTDYMECDLTIGVKNSHVSTRFAAQPTFEWMTTTEKGRKYVSHAHFQALQKMIEELEKFDFREVTDEVKPSYDDQYFHLCTLERPASEQEKGPIYCDTVEDLYKLLEQVNPPMQEKQVWFCEVVSSVKYRMRADRFTVLVALNENHHRLSPGCSHSAIRVMNSGIIVSHEALNEDSTIPDWARERLAELLFESE